jgi:hypothetical protein
LRVSGIGVGTLVMPPLASLLIAALGWREASRDNWKAKAMQVPSETKPALWGAAGGAIALAIVGFTWGGWMTTGTANKLADQRADSAVVAILTPICVDKFQQNGDAIANLAALRKISSSWEQGNFIQKGGWATRPGATSADYVLARACAEKLVQASNS